MRPSRREWQLPSCKTSLRHNREGQIIPVAAFVVGPWNLVTTNAVDELPDTPQPRVCLSPAPRFSVVH